MYSDLYLVCNNIGTTYSAFINFVIISTEGEKLLPVLAIFVVEHAEVAGVARV